MNELNITQLCAVTLKNLSHVDNIVLSISDVEVIEVASEVTKAASFGAVTGIIIALLVDFILSVEYDKLGSPTINLKLHKLITEETLLRTIAICILVAMMPILFFSILLALCYKLVCVLIIKAKDERYAGFLDSFDVFWSLKDDTSKSIITVLGFIEAQSSQDVIDKIKAKLKSISEDHVHSKIFFRKTEVYGFYYWRRYSNVDIDQYVKYIKVLNGTTDINMEDLEVAMTNISNMPLPYNEQGLFQIMVIKNKIQKSDKNSGKFGIIFRIDHSLGDGISLLDFLRQTLSDADSKSCFQMSPLPDANKSVISLLDMTKKLLMIPVCFVDGILRKPDINSLHGPTLTGKKIFKWTSSDENLLKSVKEIKRSQAGLTFSEVLALALSSGLQKYFSKTATSFPNHVAVVLPVKCPNFTTNKVTKLENDFSVTILDLPVQGHYKTEEIKMKCKNLRLSADPITNYYFLKLVGYVLPTQVLKPLLNSSQATMVFSNLPGPESLAICGGNALDSLLFFVPHKGTTGLGITALSYGGKLGFAAMADAALVPDPTHLAVILDGMVEELARLHQIYVQ